MKGRKPKPTALRLVGGNAGKRTINRREPVPASGVGDPPEWMNEDQAKAWRWAIGEAPAGMLRSLDQSALTAWIIAADLHRQATEKLNAGTMLIRTREGYPMQSPYLAIVNRQAQIMLKAAAELGFTPSSRSRVEVGPSEEENPEDRFFG